MLARVGKRGPPGRGRRAIDGLFEGRNVEIVERIPGLA
jgi:hypothetical protein